MMFSKKDLFKLILPLILQSILSTLTGTINSMMVSNAGDAAVSGVSLVTTLDNLLIIAFTAIVTGGSVVVSQAIGQGDTKLMQNSSKQLLYCVAFISLLITVVVFSLRVPLLNLLYGDVEADVMYHALNYFSIISLSFPLLAVYQVASALFRVMGDTITCMYLSFASNILVIFSNFIFISKLGMGAAGAALSTVISRLIFSVLVIVMLHSKKRMLYFVQIFRYRPDFPLIKKILRIGIPTGIENSMHNFGKLLTASLISTMGTVAVAANSVALNLANFQYMAGNAIGRSTTTVVGRCIGAGEMKQAKKYAHMLLFICYALLIGTSLIILIFTKPLLSLYGLSQASAQLAAKLLRLHVVVAILIWPLGFYLPNVFRAVGDAKFPMKIASFAMWVFRVAGAYLLASDGFSLFGLSVPGMGLGIIGVWYAMFADWVFRAFFYSRKFFSGRWLKNYKDV
ncbi:MAG: MATE family efflux transporter [Clostridia bacterium]|nr:MATE family efflux transporter [Clostridia bacterium]